MEPNRTLSAASSVVSVLCRSAWHHRCPSVRPVTRDDNAADILRACTGSIETDVHMLDRYALPATQHIDGNSGLIFSAADTRRAR